MQWPPRPGPGLKRMKPNGFVAAASTTSQMSIPIRSQSTASSLTSAMLTARKVFSRSFVSSAASGVETRWTVSIARRVELGGALGARGRDPADDLRRRLRRPVGAARVDALGREREVEVLACAQAARLEDRLEELARRARPRRRLEHDELALPQHLREAARRALDDREVGLALARERRRHRDHDRVALGDLGVVGRRAELSAVDERREALGGDVLDVALAAVQLLDELGHDVDDEDGAARLGERRGVRDSDVSGADYGNVKRLAHAAARLATTRSAA